uniref:F-box domain-containing protein n=1 Tax=Oryza punctata TaxID=4537 RepID=A0A0E0KF67_ORYPU
MENGLSDEVLKAVFPLLDGKDLVFCMLVCRQWREIAKDDYFWKCICARKWPSICKQPPSDANYQKLYLTFSKPRKPQHLPVPKLTFEDLVFYIDMWLDGSLIFSQAVSGCILRGGLQNTPCGIPDVLVAHLTAPDCILMMEVEPKLEITMGPSITVSVLAHRKDTKKMACVINKSTFDYIDSNAARALAYEYLRFSPRYPFISDIRAWMSLLFLYKGTNVIEVFGIELDFCDAARSETEILWLLDMLDWK